MLRVALFGLLAAAGLWYANELIKFADLHKVIYNQQPGICHHVEGVYQPDQGMQGAEDVEVLPNGLAIFSSGLNYMRYPSLKHWKGRMMSLNFNKSAEPAVELKILGFSEKLNPHGISLWMEAESIFVYVIQHAMEDNDDDESVEKFSWNVKAGTLTHIRTIKDPSFHSLNDLTITGLDKFYVTNDYTFRNNWLRRLELYSFLPTNNVVYYDGKLGHIVAGGLQRPNGVGISPDHKFLYVAETGSKSLSIFKIISPTNLEQISSTYLGTLPDNINIDPDTGDLWIGTHPVGYKIVMKVIFPVGTVAPSLILRVKVDNGRVKDISQIYADDGQILSASGGASFYKGGILIGTPTHKLLYCECLIC